MSKAKELAEKAYPEGDTYIFGDASIACQVAYVKGYHQAKKDLIEKGIEFLKDHLEGYDIFGSDIERSVETFKLAMKYE